MTTDIWGQFNQQLLGFIQTKVNDKETAKDILQDVFVKIYQNINQLKSQNKLTSWVYQITRNTIIDYYRSKKLNVDHLNMAEDIAAEESETFYDFSNCIKPFIEDLSTSDRDILMQTTFGNTSQKVYAAEHNMSYSAAKSKVQRARTKLKNSFMACCEVQADAYGNIISANEDCDC